MFDELDERGNPTGNIVSREEAHKTGKWHRAVAMFLYNHKKDVLLQKRSMQKKNWAGRWDVTSGHVDAGESSLESAVREFEEELGIKLTPEEITFIGSSQTTDTEGDMDNRHFNEYFVTQKDIDLDSVTVQLGEVDAVEWIEFQKLKQLVINRDPKLTEKWQAFDALIEHMENPKGKEQ